MMGIEPLETLEGGDYPTCRQLSVFLENRLGQLLRITRLLEDEPIRILGLSVEGTVDCSILRLLVDDPDAAHDTLVSGRFAVTEGELLVVKLPPGKRGIMTVCSALIAAEVNINYAYTAWATTQCTPCLAIQVDHLALGARVLASKNFEVLRQEDL